jgi:hypothetical protein
MPFVKRTIGGTIRASGHVLQQLSLDSYSATIPTEQFLNDSTLLVPRLIQHMELY